MGGNTKWPAVSQMGGGGGGGGGDTMTQPVSKRMPKEYFPWMYSFQTTPDRRGYFVTGAAVVPETLIQHLL